MPVVAVRQFALGSVKRAQTVTRPICVAIGRKYPVTNVASTPALVRHANGAADELARARTLRGDLIGKDP